MRKGRFPRRVGIALVAAVALFSQYATAAPASAALATTPPAYNSATTTDSQSIGHIAFYDASGDRVIGGSLTDLGGAIYAVADSVPRAGATASRLSIAAPD
ncbi:MAG: hypothetical protein WCG62_06535, partial [Actinomycetes bacterium]